MAFEFAGAGALDYFPCRYGKSRLMFRGPGKNLTPPFVAVLGGSETYGKFVAEPYPRLIEAEMGLQVVNLGLMNAGPDVFLKDQELLNVAKMAEITVLQIVGAQNLSNRYYTVHPRRNDRFLAASPKLRALFPEIDFTDFHFTRHLLRRLQEVSSDRFEVVAEDLRAFWVGQMRELIQRLDRKVILLWLAVMRPPPPGRRADLMHDPLLVDREMVDALRPLAANYVEVRPSKATLNANSEGMVLGPMDIAVAAGLPGPQFHREIAKAVIAPLKDWV